MVDVPQELLDEIIGHLPQSDTQSLRNCSLVAKSWIRPSRRRLFEVVSVERTADLRSWLDNISPTNVELLHHVRSLFCRITDPLYSPCQPTNRVGFLHDYLPSFHQLRCLNLTAGRLLWFTQAGTPLPFQHTLTYLSLFNCGVRASALVTLINRFPNLEQLDIHSLIQETDDQPIPPVSRPLRRLSVYGFNNGGSLGLLDELLALRQRCDEIVVAVFTRSCPSLAQRVIDGAEASIRRLRLLSGLGRIGNLLTLSDCRELRELEICPWYLGATELDLISSITSTNIRKITLTPIRELSAEHTYRTQLDNSLSRLAKQSRCGLRLEVEFRAVRSNLWDKEWGLRKYLPRFIESNGRVRVVDRTNTIVYCSDGARVIVGEGGD